MTKRLVVSITILTIMALAVLPLTTGCSEPAAETAAPSTPSTPSTPATPATPEQTTPEPTTPEPAPVETMELRFVTGSQGLTPGGAMGRALLQWNDDVEAASAGRIKINVLTAACPDPEIFDVVARGAGDIGFNPIQFTTGRFPSLEAMTLPDIGIECRHPGQAAYELWKTYPGVADEFHELEVLSIWAMTVAPPGISFATVDKPIYTLEDFQGLKIGKYGEWGTKLMDALGGTPVAVPPNDIYESMQRKIVDASCMDPEMLESLLIWEVAGYWHNLCHEFSPVFFGVNKDVWASIPADIQKIMVDYAAELPATIEDDLAVTVGRAVDTAVAEYGLEVIDYSPEELERWRERQQPVQDEYIAMLDSKGIDGNALFAEILRLEEKYAK